MSIYIKGIDIPQDGIVRIISIESDGSIRFYGGSSVIARAIEVPPHGGLIDVVALWEKEKNERALREHCPKGQSIIFDAGFLAGYRAACQIASKMPTIIPADPAEEGE